MTGRVLLDDPHDARVTRTATGLLAAFNAAGVLEPADVHVADRHRAARRRVRRRGAARGGARRARRYGWGRSASTSHAVRGTVLGAGDEPRRRLRRCRGPSPPDWVAACAASPLVADGADTPGGRPLRLVDGLLYLERYWRQEEVVRTELADARRRPRRRWTSTGCVPGSARLFRRRRRSAGDRQRLAAAVAALPPGHGPRGRPGHGQDHHRREAARAAPATSPAPRRGSRWPPRPARPRPGCRRPSRRSAAASTSPRDRRLDPAPAAGLAARPQPVPPRPRTTGCPTTWSSSTRRRWCR